VEAGKHQEFYQYSGGGGHPLGVQYAHCSTEQRFQGGWVGRGSPVDNGSHWGKVQEQTRAGAFRRTEDQRRQSIDYLRELEEARLSQNPKAVEQVRGATGAKSSKGWNTVWKKIFTPLGTPEKQNDRRRRRRREREEEERRGTPGPGEEQEREQEGFSSPSSHNHQYPHQH